MRNLSFRIETSLTWVKRIVHIIFRANDYLVRRWKCSGAAKVVRRWWGRNLQYR